MMRGHFKRSAHPRRLKSGHTVFVSECWLKLMGRKPRREKKLSRCPHCGAWIMSVPMPNLGWGHFESGEGLSRVKHPCFNVGAELSQKRDEETLDLFPDALETR